MGVTRAQKVRLGVFVGGGLAVLVGGMVVLAGMKLGEKRETYHVRYGDGAVSLSGLDVGSPVKYSGIRIGRVEGIRVAPDDVSVIIVDLSVPEGTPIAEDSKANLGSQGITGLKYIELTRGSRAARVRAPGEDIPPGASPIDNLTDQAGQIAGKVSVALDNVNAFTGPDMKDRVARVLDRTAALLETSEAMVAENREGVRAVVAEMGVASTRFTALSDELLQSSQRINRMLGDLHPKTGRVLDESAALIHALRKTGQDLDRTMGAARALLESADALVAKGGAVPKSLERLDRLLSRAQLTLVQIREDLVESVAFLREAAENMAYFSEKVREDPSLLLLGDREEDGL